MEELKFKFSLDKYEAYIDLSNYGFEDNKKWEDLSEDEQNEVRDSLTEQMIIHCHIDCR